MEASSYNRLIEASSYDQLAKLLVIGDQGVGKSSLVACLGHETTPEAHGLPFVADVIPTIGVDFRIAHLRSDCDGKLWKMHVWDATGQSRWGSIRTAYHRVVQGVVIAYDCTSADSFEHVADWVAEVQTYAPSGARMCLVATKADLKDQRKVPPEQGRSLAQSLGIPFVETSAVLGLNVRRAFEAIIGELAEAPPILPRSNAIPSTTKSPRSSTMCLDSSEEGLLSCCCVGLRLLPRDWRARWFTSTKSNISGVELARPPFLKHLPPPLPSTSLPCSRASSAQVCTV